MKPPVQVNVVVDFDALIGRHRPGTDRAYIAGLGAVPVSAVGEILDDAFLVAAVMQGTEVAKIKRLGRHVPLELRDALASATGSAAPPPAAPTGPASRWTTPSPTPKAARPATRTSTTSATPATNRRPATTDNEPTPPAPGLHP